MLLQLYLHFPFCKRKCLYCDFISAAAGEETMAAYCLALEKEIRAMGETYAGAQVSTVFLGGGTPSVVPVPLIKQVLKTLRESFVFTPDVEFTSEANPGTLSEAWLETLMNAGLNRLSMGVQAAQDSLLQRIGRIHTFREARESIRLAQRMGIGNINADAMYGLPGQSQRDYLETLERLCALSVAHLSAYSLILEEGTPLHRMVQAGEMTVPDDDACADMTAAGIELLKQHGFEQYEISNYAKEGFRCRHNMGYWQGAWYLGLGVAAHSMLPSSGKPREQGAVRIRQANPEKLQVYLENSPDVPRTQEQIGAEDAMFETMMLGLRMNDGVSTGQFEKLFGIGLQERYGVELASLVRDGLGVWRNTPDGDLCFGLTPRGMLLQNQVLLRLSD